jgi:hypothetical protein
VIRLTLVLIAGVALVLPGAVADLAFHSVLCVLLSLMHLLRVILRLLLGVTNQLDE